RRAARRLAVATLRRGLRVAGRCPALLASGRRRAHRSGTAAAARDRVAGVPVLGAARDDRVRDQAGTGRAVLKAFPRPPRPAAAAAGRPYPLKPAAHPRSRRSAPLAT